MASRNSPRPQGIERRGIAPWAGSEQLGPERQDLELPGASQVSVMCGRLQPPRASTEPIF